MTQQATHMVGLGASAGGIQALKAFFSQVREEPDMAFVVVTHLSPNRESHLHDVMRRFATLPVEVIKDGDPVQAGVVHVMPQNVTLTIKEGRLRLLEVDPGRRDRKPIDTFFSALAVDQKERAIGVVLSGVGEDGTLGLQAIKEHGGVTLAQGADDKRLEYPQMPDNAIARGAVDFAIPAEKMPQKLRELQQAAVALDALLRGQEPQSAEGEQKRLQGEISKLLRNQSGRDFSGYKSQTFFRRVARRMQITLTATPEAYLERLRKDPAEVMALFGELLISVTDFFRDKDAYKALSKQVMPSLLAKRGANDVVRIWVPGCATGQEAYSLAMLIRENMDGLTARPRVQIFATDIDEPALTVARSARYPNALMKNVSDERKRRFFRQDEESQIVVSEIRDMCIFSAHNLISDPPFSHMDLVSCRNLLIYFGAELQQRAIQTFHYALKPGGFLFLGGSESLGQHDDLFTAVDKKHRIFQSLDLGKQRPRIPIPLEEFRKASLRFEEASPTRSAGTLRMIQCAERQIIERHSPAHVVVRSDGNIEFFSAYTGQYFDTPRGTPTRQIFDSVRRDLRQCLRWAWRETLKTGKPALSHVRLPDDDSAMTLSIIVELLNLDNDSEQMFLIVFRPNYEMKDDREQVVPPPAMQTDEDLTGAVERELQERLQSVMQEYETSIEELNTLNEELVSANEEAQSTNEELQASKEEMQSLNEELSTVNADLNDKVDKLAKANADLRDLQDATGISIVFLDRDLMIRSFTPAAAKLLNVRESDIGRPLTDLAGALKFPSLQNDIQQAFNEGSSIEHRLPPGGEFSNYLVRSVPYLEDGATAGVVVTFVDVTSLAEFEEQRVRLIEEAANRTRQMQDRRLHEVRAADSRKARLMAVLAHDLRTPLVAMLGALDLFRDNTDQSAQERILNRAKTDGHAMLTLIDDVLELARLGAGEARLRPEPFAPIALLRQIGDLVRLSAERHGTEIMFDVDDFPMLSGDTASLRRVLLNFATNAVKATHDGSIGLCAKLVASGAEGHTVTFSVTDTGCGIAPEDIPRLFRDFGMLDRDTARADGTGLGLAICRRLAAAMSGEVGVESTLGKGSRFWLRVTLPEADSVGSDPDNETNDPLATLVGLKVLVAEDHDIIRQLTCANLARAGMLPTEAADGIIAVDLAEAEEFDLILMDLKMPRLDGDEAASRIRSGNGASARARIICVTAHQSPEIALMLSDLAFDACVRKPLDLSNLAALMQGDSTSSTAAVSAKDFDNDNLAHFREIDGGALLARTLKAFATEIETTRIDLAALIKKRDTLGANRLVHKLVGLGDILGARTLSMELRKFEDLIRDDDIEALEGALEWIKGVMTKTQAQLEQLIKEADQKNSVGDVGPSTPK